MPLRLDIKKKLSTRTDRVKSVDISTTEPWVLIGLYTGHLQIWNYDTQQLVKSFEVVDQTPIRFARFISRKQWIICGSDDMLVRVYNVNTMEKIREFEAHMDYIRSLEIHPVHPYVLTSSDDMQIKMWDWEKQWSNVQSFDGHSHYVMMVKFNPKDTNTFSSASLDRSVKVWSLGSSLPNFSLEGHQAGVNCVDYFQGGDKPYICSGSDDHMVKIWDYQTKACVHTLQSHTNNVSAVVFHPTLPIILSGSEDGTVRVWHSTTYRLENTLNYGMERCWALGVSSFSNKIAAGFDEGVVVLQMGREMPVVSMDKTGKLLLATSKDIQAGPIRMGTTTSASGEEIPKQVHDGEMIEVAFKSAGPLESHLQELEHNLNGRFVVACGDGEYVIYSSLALRNRSFGSAVDFGWSAKQANDYATRDAQGKIHLFQDFKETNVVSVAGFQPEALFGGHLIGVVGPDCVVFYSWQGLKECCRIEVSPKNGIFWSEEGDHVCLACEDSFFILSCNQDQLSLAISSGDSAQAEKSFDYLDEIAEQCKTGQWIGDCFIYTNASHRLNYYVGGEIVTLAHLDREQLLLGFLPKENRVFVMDKQRTISSYQVLESVLRYQTAVVRGDFALANTLLPQVPRSHYNKIARFLEAKGFKEAALQVAVDPEHKFELALQLEKFALALQLMREEIVPSTTTSASSDLVDIAGKWKQLGDLALSRGNVGLAEECCSKAQDLPSLLLIYSSTGNLAGLRALQELSAKQGMTNVSFLCSWLCGDYSTCCELLKESKRLPEACFMALNYSPALLSPFVKLWKQELLSEGHGLSLRIAKALADPDEHPELFPGLQQALAKEMAYKKQIQVSGGGGGEKRELSVVAPQAIQEEPAAKLVPPVVAQVDAQVDAQMANQIVEESIKEASAQVELEEEEEDDDYEKQLDEEVAGVEEEEAVEAAAGGGGGGEDLDLEEDWE